nr:ABC transporter permease [Mammaliicoccus sp. Marseille-Q6498]
MLNNIKYQFDILYHNIFYRIVMMLLALPLAIFAWLKYLKVRNQNTNSIDQSRFDAVYHQLETKYRYIGKNVTQSKLQAEAKYLLKEEQKTSNEIYGRESENYTYRTVLKDTLFKKPLAVKFIFSFLLWGFLYIYHYPYAKYIFERIIMFLFVVVGVIFTVFTLLYLSPTDPASNILGDTATQEQINSFKQTYGLNDSYLVQLYHNIVNIFTFDLGQSFKGGEDVFQSVSSRFPITLLLTISSLIIAVVIAIPIGVISAVKRNTLLDGILMSLALIGLSIPNFWFGILLIINFSIKWNIFPASYAPENYASIILPIIVLGTGLTASIARMTRSSVLEVLEEDYIVTARSKGLSKSYIIRKHILRNALIPIITLIGLMFSGLLGGVAVTEKVFGVDGIGSYIVDKQFIPDIPAVMAGVVYIAVVISLINLIVDLIYTFIDPKIREQIK